MSFKNPLPFPFPPFHIFLPPPTSALRLPPSSFTFLCYLSLPPFPLPYLTILPLPLPSPQLSPPLSSPLPLPLPSPLSPSTFNIPRLTSSLPPFPFHI